MDDPVCHVVAADRVPQPSSGSRTADSFFSFFMPSGSKSALFCIFFCLPVIYIFVAYHPLIFTLACIPFPHRIQSFFPHISCPDTAASIVSSCTGPPIPRLSPLHTPNGPALLSPAMFRPSPRYTVALVPLYLQLPSPRPLSGIYAASESLPFERSFRLLYCFANGLPLPVDSDCIQCLMYEKLSCFR